MKKIFCLFLSVICLFACASCGIRPKDQKESVVKKEAEGYYGYKLKEKDVVSSGSFQEGGVSAYVTGISYENVVTKVNLKIKNETDSPLRIMTANLSVNGIMSTDSLFFEITPKNEQDAFIEISNEWFENMNIEMIKDIEFVIKVFDSKDNEIMQSDVIKIQTNAPRSYKQKYDDSGTEIYNGNGIKLCVRSLQKSDLSDDMEIVFYAENNTDSAISIMSSDVSVNGKKIEPVFVMTVGKGKRAVDTMLFYSDDLKKIGIKEFTDVKASFRAFNENLETVLDTEIVKVDIF